MCNKRSLSKHEAEDLRYFIRSNRGHKGFRRRNEQRKYFCKECNAFHLTSKSIKR